MPDAKRETRNAIMDEGKTNVTCLRGADRAEARSDSLRFPFRVSFIGIIIAATRFRGSLL